MWIKTGLLILLVSVFVSSAQPSKEVSRSLQTQDLSVEVFQVLELPLIVHEALLVKSEKGYVLNLSLANSSELRMIGLRYSLVTIDSESQPHALVNRTEGFSMRVYATKN